MTGARRPQWAMVVGLAVMWVLLWGEVSVITVVGGLLIGVGVTVALPMPRVDFRGRVHPWGLAVLLGRFVVDLVVASIQVGALALRPGYRVQGAVIRVRLRSQSDLYLTLTAQLCSLVPGSLIVEAHRLTGTLYVHVLDVRQAGGVEAARAHVLEIEERVLRALGSTSELAQWGL